MGIAPGIAAATAVACVGLSLLAFFVSGSSSTTIKQYPLHYDKNEGILWKGLIQIMYNKHWVLIILFKRVLSMAHFFGWGRGGALVKNFASLKGRV